MSEHSKNFKKVKDYYDNGLWTDEMVINATKNPKGNPWITEEEALEILEPVDILGPEATA